MFIQYVYSQIQIKSKSSTNFSSQSQVDVFKSGNAVELMLCV